MQVGHKCSELIGWFISIVCRYTNTTHIKSESRLVDSRLRIIHIQQVGHKCKELIGWFLFTNYSYASTSQMQRADWLIPIYELFICKYITNADSWLVDSCLGINHMLVGHTWLNNQTAHWHNGVRLDWCHVEKKVPPSIIGFPLRTEFLYFQSSGCRTLYRPTSGNWNKSGQIS